MARQWNSTALRIMVALVAIMLTGASGWAQVAAPSPGAPPPPASACTSNTLPPDRTVRLFLDESQVHCIPALKRVSITNPRIADVVVIGPDEVRVDGLTTGRTTLYVWDTGGRQRYEVVVLNRRDDLASVIKEAINLPEIVVLVQNNRVLLKGWLDNEAQRRVATEIARIYQEPVVDLMQVRGAGSIAPEAEIKRILNLPEVKVSVIYDPRQAAAAAAQGPNALASVPISAIILEGFVDDQRDSQRAQVVAQAYSGNVQNLIEVTRPLQILVQTHLLELSVTDATQYGFNWGTTQVTGTPGGPFTVAGAAPVQNLRFIENVYNGTHGQGQFFGARTDIKNNYPWEFDNLNRLDPLFLTINWLISKGKGKVLANPRVVTRSGVNAEVNVGGQIVYPLVSATGTPTTGFQPFGVVLNMTPEVDHKGNINTKLLVTVSNPDSGLGTTVGGAFVPGLRTRTTRSEVTVKDGEHIVVSGLLSETIGKVHSKTPYLSRLPLIGDLFTNKRYDISKTELVVVVTPNLVTAEEKAQLATAVEVRKSGNGASLRGKARHASHAGTATVITPSGEKVVEIERREYVTSTSGGARVERTQVSAAGTTSAMAAASGVSGPGTTGYRYPVPGARVPPNPARGFQTHGADPKKTTEWDANKTAYGYAPGTEPARLGAAPKPQVPTVPPGDYTARGRMQGILAGMREKVRWAKDQEEMDKPILPEPPEYIHSGGDGRNPRHDDRFAKRTYDSITPREALRREALSLQGKAPTGYIPPPSPTEASATVIIPVSAPSATGRTDGANNGAIVIGKSTKPALKKAPVKVAAPIKAKALPKPVAAVEEEEEEEDLEERFEDLAKEALGEAKAGNVRMSPPRATLPQAKPAAPVAKPVTTVQAPVKLPVQPVVPAKAAVAVAKPAVVKPVAVAPVAVAKPVVAKAVVPAKPIAPAQPKLSVTVAAKPVAIAPKSAAKPVVKPAAKPAAKVAKAIDEDEEEESEESTDQEIFQELEAAFDRVKAGKDDVPDLKL